MENDDIVESASFHPAVRTFIMIVPCLFLLLSIVGIPLILIWFLGPGQLYSRRYYNGLYCELTQSKLKFAKGVLVRVEKTIPLENIQDLTFIEGPLLKMFKLAMLKIETAGNSGAGAADMKLIGIVGAQEFRNRVLDQRDRLRQKNESPSNSSNEILVVLKEIRDLLKK